MTCEFCELPNYLFNDIINDINKNFDLENLSTVIKNTKSKRYNLVITGSIGVGKSTISQILSIILKDICLVHTYPEYISVKYKNHPIGQDIFNMFMNNKISAATFQNFVIDMWITMFMENKYTDLCDRLTINVFERLPHDAVYCFTKEQVGKSITEHEFQTIVDKYNNLVDALKIPDYADCNLQRVTNDSKISDTIIKILNIILNDLKHDVETTRVIGLMISEYKHKQRIQQRGRESEENYEDITLLHYNEYYKLLYFEIESNSILEATDLKRINFASI